MMASAMAMVSTRGLTATYMKVSSLMITSMAWELESFKTAIHISESTSMVIQMVWALTGSQMGEKTKVLSSITNSTIDKVTLFLIAKCAQVSSLMITLMGWEPLSFQTATGICISP